MRKIKYPQKLFEYFKKKDKKYAAGIYTCDECGKHAKEYILFCCDHIQGENWDDDAHWVCGECLKKALEMLNE